MLSINFSQYVLNLYSVLVLNTKFTCLSFEILTLLFWWQNVLAWNNIFKNKYPIMRTCLLLTRINIVVYNIGVQLPLSLLKTAQNHPMLIELKNGETYNGMLVACDSWMNVHLRFVIWTKLAKGVFFCKISLLLI